MKMKILFVIDSLRFGGAERQLIELVKGLLRSERYDIHLAALSNSDEGYWDIIYSAGIRVHYYPRRWKYDLFFPLFSMVRCIFLNDINLIHGFMNMGSLFAMLAAKITHKPVVCSAIRDAKDSSPKGKILKRILAELSDIYVSNSKAGFVNRFEKMKPNFRVVYNGMDLSRFDVNPVQVKNIKTEFGLSESINVIAMVGTLSNNKDHVTFLMTVPLVLQEFPQTKFLIIGDGPNRKYLEDMTNKLGIQNNVMFTGFRNDIDYIYQLMDLCVLLTNTKEHLEGIPNVLIEAMASGVPVVASKGGGTSELIDSGVTGILVSPHNPRETAEAILYLLKNPKRKTEMAKHSVSYVRRQFSLDRYIEDYERIYHELLVTE